MNASYNPTPPSKPFQTLEDLEAYQLAREFRKAMYAVKASETSGLKESPPSYGVDDNSDPFTDLPF